MKLESKPLTGILGFPVAPFDSRNRLDEEAFRTNVRFLVDSGLDAVFVCAGSGEFQSLGMEEYAAMIGIAAEEAGERIPVFAGTGGNLIHALRYAERAVEGGADGLLILPPYLIAPEQEGLYQYYRTIAGHTALPCLLYQRDQAVFAPDTLVRLCELPNVAGFKDGYGNMELTVEQTQSLGSRLHWMNGMPFAEITMPAYAALGFQSYSSALSNYLPHVSRAFYNALLTKDNARLEELYRECLLPINRIRQKRKGYAVSLIKAGMQIVGLPAGAAVRAPLVPVEREHYLELERIVNRAHGLYPAAPAGEGTVGQ